VRLAGSKRANRANPETVRTRRRRPPCTARTTNAFGVHLLFATLGIGLEVGRPQRPGLCQTHRRGTSKGVPEALGSGTAI
jgi:hypothetical protein